MFSFLHEGINSCCQGSFSLHTTNSETREILKCLKRIFESKMPFVRYVNTHFTAWQCLIQ